MDYHEEDTTTQNSDDLSVLRVLLHTIKGISPVAGGTMDFTEADEETEFEIAPLL